MLSRIFFTLALIIILIFYVTNMLRGLAYYPTNLENITKLESKIITNFKLCKNPKLEYYNKDYLFYKIQIDNSEKIYIIESKNLFLSPFSPTIADSTNNINKS